MICCVENITCIVNDVHFTSYCYYSQRCRLCCVRLYGSLAARILPLQLPCFTVPGTSQSSFNTLHCVMHVQGSSASVLVADVLQLVLRGARDTIPNVRFTAVRALQEMAPHLDAGAVDSQVCVCLLGFEVDAELALF